MPKWVIALVVCVLVLILLLLLGIRINVSADAGSINGVNAIAQIDQRLTRVL